MDSLVYVVVLNWNLKDDTMACVESIQAGTYKHHRIVIVDNGSQDDSATALAQHFGGTVDLVLNEENLGFAGGMNIGIGHALTAGASYVLLLNNDVVAAPDLLESLLGVASTFAPEAILGPAVCYYDDPQRFWRLGAVHRWGLPIPLEIGRDAPDTGQYADPFEVDYIPGCAMWVPAQVFRAVGLLNRDFFMYYEDADFCLRARRAGFRVMVVPRTRVWHKVSRSAQQVPSKSAYHHTRNRVRFYSASTRGLGRALAHAYILVTTVVKICRSGRNLELASSFWRGLWDGWRGKKARAGMDVRAPGGLG